MAPGMKRMSFSARVRVITAQVGLGYIIKFASSALELGLVFAALTLLCVVGLVLYGAVVLAERLVLAKYGG